MNNELVKKCRKMLFNSTRHSEHLVRAEGARLLGEIKDRAAVPYLVRMLRHDNWYCKIAAVYALAAIHDQRGIPVLRDMARDPLVFDFPGKYNHDMIRIASVMALLTWRDLSGIKRISDLLRMKNLEAFLHLGPTILALPNSPGAHLLKEQVNFEFLQFHAKNFRSGLQIRIVQALPFFKTKKSLTWIKDYLKHFSPYVRAAAAQALLQYRNSPEHRKIVAALLKKEKTAFARIKISLLLVRKDGRADLLRGMVNFLKNMDYFIRATAIDALAEAGRFETAEKIVPLLDDGHFYVRLCAIDAMEKLKFWPAADRIQALLSDPHPRVQLQAAKYIVGLSAGNGMGLRRGHKKA